MRVLSITNFLLCGTILGAHLLHLISVWDKIPSSILLMYSGESPSQYGPKELLFLIPGLAVLLWIFIHVFRVLRKKFNYINLTEDNREIQYKAMNIMLMSLQILSFAGLISINEAFLRNTLNISSGLYTAVALTLLILCAVPPIVLAIWSRTVFNKKVSI